MKPTTSDRFLISIDPIEKATALRQWLKRVKLAQSAFDYFRGIAKEFYVHWAKQDVLPSPVVWSCEVAPKNRTGQIVMI